MPKRNLTRNLWKRWIYGFLAVNLLLMGGAVAAVLTVDPYQIYHRVRGGHPRFDLRLQRFLVPGLARTASYEVALVGTSMLQNIPNSAVRRICGRRAINLCISGASIHEEARAMALALSHPGTKTIVATLDYNSLSGGSLGQAIGVNDPFPEYLYTGSVFDKLPYLLSWDSLVASYQALYRDRDPNEPSPDWPWRFDASKVFAAASAVQGIDPANINKSFGMINLNLAAMESAFADNIFPLLEKSRGVKIHFVFPPYSILVWHDYAQRGQIPTYFAFKKWLLAQEERFGNFDIVDYQDRADIITDMSRYADIYHSDETGDEQMVRSACTGQDLLDKTNIEVRSARLLDLVESTDPAEIVRKALAGGGQR